MPTAFPIKISSFIQDIDKSFWNGNANIKASPELLAQIIDNNPNITIGALRNTEGRQLVRAGLDFTLESGAITLGEPHGAHAGFGVTLDVSSQIDADLFVILSQEGLQAIEGSQPADLKEMLMEHTTLTGHEGLVVLVLNGKVGAKLNADLQNKPGLAASFRIDAGGAYQWFYCRSSADGVRLLAALGNNFEFARLPQTRIQSLIDAGKPILLQQNEIIFSRTIGSLSLGVETSLGYEFTGTRDFNLGKLSLASTLYLQAGARLSIGYALTGAFQIMVLPGTSDGWIRVVVQKDRTSQFDFAFGVSAQASLETTGLPDGENGGVALVESLLGLSSPQLLREIMEWAQTPPSELQDKANGFIMAIVEEWTGKGFDELFQNTKPGKKLTDLLDQVREAETVVTGLDDRIIRIYEQFLGKLNFPEIIEKLKNVLSLVDPEAARKKLLQNISSPLERQFLELLMNSRFADLFLDFSGIQHEALSAVSDFEKLLTEGVGQTIENFINAKLKSLGIEDLLSKLQEFDTPDKLKNLGVGKIQELVTRLIGEPLSKLLNDPKVVAFVKEMNDFANHFNDFLNRINSLIKKALNAKGRFEIAEAYQKISERQELVNIQIHIGTNDKQDIQGIRLFEQAVVGDFKEVFQNDSLSSVQISSAAFTNTVRAVSTVNVHILGWDYQGVGSVFSRLDRSITVGETGLMTVYKYEVDGKVTNEDNLRATDLSCMLEVAGIIKGVSENASVKIDPVAILRNIQSRFSYQISDNLTSLEELEDYFEVGTKLRIIGAPQVETLMETVRTFRGLGLNDNTFGRVELSYSFSFEADALVKALTTDFSGDVHWWSKEGGIDLHDATHKTVLKAMYIDRLIASYFRPEIRPVPVLFQSGVFEDHPNILLKSEWLQDRISLFKGKSVLVKIAGPDRAWAHRHSNLCDTVSNFFSRYRMRLAGGPMALSEFLDSLRDLVKNLGELEKGSTAQKALPFLLLDEMVRRASNNDSKGRKALLEVKLFDKNKEVAYIPISS